MRVKKWIRITAAAAAALGLALFLWRLDIPHWKKLDLQRLNGQPAMTTVYAADGSSVGAFPGGIKQVRISLGEVPEHVRNAFIAAEDQRFYSHHGVDPRRIAGALWQDIRSFSFVQGASTITQQLIKLTHLSTEKTLSRKAQEIALSLQLEKILSKDEILTAYLNTVYFGHGAYGIEAAAKTYFDVSASDLTIAQGALLAGIIKAPSVYAPHLNPEKAVARRNLVLLTMEKNGFISADERRSAESEPVVLAEDDQEQADLAWYMDAALSEAQRLLKCGAEAVLSGGYKIHTGLDSSMQLAAEALFRDPENFPEPASDGTPAQSALVAEDVKTGEIRALVGGRSYDVRRGLNRATQMRRQPGSAFKPISTYAAAVDACGFLPSSIVDDTPRDFGGYAPGNAGGGSYGPVTLREALSRSLNIATVGLAEEVTLPRVREYARRFGIDLEDSDNNLALSLGALTSGVSPAQLTAAYCALGNGGARVEAHVITRIEDAEGRTVFESEPSSARAVTPETAYMLTDMLRTAAQSGSAKALSSFAAPVAGKTGTVAEGSDGTRDIWTVAYTPQIAVCAWMGFDQPDETHALSESLGGSGYPARLCAKWLNAVSGALDGRDFIKPAGVRTVLLDAVALNETLTPLLSTERTPRTYTLKELFHENDAPRTYSDNWTAPSPIVDFRLISMDGETPVLAFTPREDSAEYVLTRTDALGISEIAVLRGEAGRELRYADTEHDLSQYAEYALMPRNVLLYEEGALLIGPRTETVRYRPAGILNKIMGAGAAEATPAPLGSERIEDQSLFS